MACGFEEQVLAQLNRMDARLARIEVMMNGDGDPREGFIVRMDRLEQAESARRWLARVTVAAAVTATIAAIVAAFLKVR